jgi:hypothetical protein
VRVGIKADAVGKNFHINKTHIIPLKSFILKVIKNMR